MNIAIISFWHVHGKDYAHAVEAMDGCRISAIWDEDENRGRYFAQQLGCTFYEDYDELLADKSIDGVVITTATRDHTSFIIKAANAKKHIFTEKVLALTKEECLKIKFAIEQNGVQFTISFPHRCRADMLFAKQLIESGELGQVTYARIRNAHNGATGNWLPAHFYDKEACGGGAMIDLGAHGMYLLHWFLGDALSYHSTFTSVTGKAVEDNAVCVMEFKNGAIGVNETGFVGNYPFILEVSGTKGGLLIRGGLGVSYVSPETEGKWVTPSNMPEPLPSPISQWISSIKTGEKTEFGLEEAIFLTEMMEGAYRLQ